MKVTMEVFIILKKVQGSKEILLSLPFLMEYLFLSSAELFVG